MAKRILHPEWRNENEPTKYPFGINASMTNGADIFIEGLFLDAILYPVGGQAQLYLSQVEITADTVTVTIGDPAEAALATGSFNLVSPPDKFKLEDALGRPAGVIISETLRLSTFQSWAVGTHTFAIEETEFAATVAVPTPEVGLRGILLSDGSLLTGEVYLVGDDGIVLSTEITEVPGECGEPAVQVTAIRVDVVGDPLSRRRLCASGGSFATPRFIETITFDDGKQTVKCTPDDNGDIKMTVGNDLAVDTVLRIRAAESGIVVEAVGSQLSGVR